MNLFLKKNSTWLGLLGFAIFIVVVAFVFRPTSFEYQLGGDESVKLVIDPSYQIALQDTTGKQLIDIRPSNMYALGHPQNAINIPVRNLLDKEPVALFDKLLKSGKEAVLYGSDELQSTSPWLLLQQLGYKNVKLLKAGFTQSNGFTEPSPALTEIPVLDTAALRVTSESKKVMDITVQKKKRESVIPVRKEASSGGGC
jgi:rhodanese-related sulfurtransferase